MQPGFNCELDRVNLGAIASQIGGHLTVFVFLLSSQQIVDLVNK